MWCVDVELLCALMCVCGRGVCVCNDACSSICNSGGRSDFSYVGNVDFLCRGNVQFLMLWQCVISHVAVVCAGCANKKCLMCHAANDDSR